MSVSQPERPVQDDVLPDRDRNVVEEPDEDVAGHVYTGALRDREPLPD